jgi:hypothetical protein
MVAARSKNGVEVTVRSKAGDEAAVCSGLGSRMAGDSGTMVSRATKEREIVWGQQITKCDEKEHGARNFRARDQM